ncbi:MAG: flavin reductase [Ilumatobacteraceae bacterium]
MAVDDELLNRVTWEIPNALALVGSRSGDEYNAMTTSWITQLSMEPVLIGIGVDNSAVTHRLINDGGSFTVNFWDADDTRVFVKFSKPDHLRGRHAQRPGGPRCDHGSAPSSTRRSRGSSTARSDRRTISARTPCSSARWSAAITNDDGTTGVDERHPHEVRRREARRPLRPCRATSTSRATRQPMGCSARTSAR